MMKLKTLARLSLILTLASTSSFGLEFGKPILAKVKLNSSTTAQALADKPIHLMNIKLTPAQRQQLITFKSSNLASVQTTNALPAKAEVGMNNTPVLDQGMHGSCVTFANTAAIDALIGKGDYVSQLCSLAVGSYIEKYGYYPSGWEGSLATVVVNQILQLGVINKKTQKLKSCGGLSDYPVNSENMGSPMAIEDYNASSENLNQNLVYKPIMSLYDRFAWEDVDQQSALMLQQVKEAIINKPIPAITDSTARLTFAVLLPVNYCSAGACGSYHAKFDTWALTKAIKNDQQAELGGHEMVIIGYDDNATVYDNEGKSHKGLLTLRNSWGTKAGDKGNYYMTYEFFRQYIMELQELMWLS